MRREDRGDLWQRQDGFPPYRPGPQSTEPGRQLEGLRVLAVIRSVFLCRPWKFFSCRAGMERKTAQLAHLARKQTQTGADLLPYPPSSMDIGHLNLKKTAGK